MKKTLLFALVLAGVSIASAKSYTVVIDQPVVVAGTEVKPGEYKLNVEQSKASFVDRFKKTVAEATVTVQEGDKKFDNTVVETSNANGKIQVQSIRLRGTKIRVAFK